MLRANEKASLTLRFTRLTRFYCAILTLVTVLVIAIASSGVAIAAEPEKSRRLLRVGLEATYPPNSWQEYEATDFNVPLANLEGVYVDGYDVRISRIIADKLDADLAIYKVDWEEIIDALTSGKIDLIVASMADTSERRQVIDFSVPYFPSFGFTLMVTRESLYRYSTSLADFEGARVLAQKATMLDELIDQIPDVIHLPGVDSIAEQLTQLALGNCDAVPVERENVDMYLATNPRFRAIQFDEGKGFEAGFTGSCVGVRKSDKELLEQVNAALAPLTVEKQLEIFDEVSKQQP